MMRLSNRDDIVNINQITKITERPIVSLKVPFSAQLETVAGRMQKR